MKTFPFSRTYKDRTVLRWPGFEFEPGKIYAVIGANGSGKSTLAKILAGVDSADGKARARDQFTVGYMPQRSYAFRMSTLKNVMLNGEDGEKADRLLVKLRLTELKKQSARRLSGGETARMALARLLMKNYELLILDEPTAAMDMENTAAAEELIREYAAESNAAVLLITHSIRQAERMADEVIFLCAGEPAETGPAERVLNAPEDPRTVRFLDFYGGSL